MKLVALLLFFGLGGLAFAQNGSMRALLEDGYEIKAAYVLEGDVRYVLQKGSSVFECWPHKPGTCYLIN